MTAAVTTEWDLRQFQHAVEESLGKMPGAAGRLFRAAWDLLSELPLGPAPTTAARPAAPRQAGRTAAQEGMQELRGHLAHLRLDHDRVGQELRRLEHRLDPQPHTSADTITTPLAATAPHPESNGPTAAAGNVPDAIVESGSGSRHDRAVTDLLEELASRAEALRDRAETIRHAAAGASRSLASSPTPAPTLLQALARQVGAWLIALGRWLTRRGAPTTTTANSSPSTGHNPHHAGPGAGVDLGSALQGLLAALDPLKARLQWIDDRLQQMTDPHRVPQPAGTTLPTPALTDAHGPEHRATVRSTSPSAADAAQYPASSSTSNSHSPGADLDTETVNLLFDRTGQLRKGSATPPGPEDLSDLALVGAEQAGSHGGHDLGGLA